MRRELGPPVEPDPRLPFAGGAIGYFAYDLGRRLERLPAIAEDAEKLPEMAVGIYDWACVVDHHERRSLARWRRPRPGNVAPLGGAGRMLLGTAA